MDFTGQSGSNCRVYYAAINYTTSSSTQTNNDSSRNAYSNSGGHSEFYSSTARVSAGGGFVSLMLLAMTGTYYFYYCYYCYHKKGRPDNAKTLISTTTNH